MDLLEQLKEKFRSELPVKQEILERERKFNEQNSSRESWILDHVYLCEGNLEALKKHPDFDARGQGIDYIIAYYATPEQKKGPCKKVTVHVPLSTDRGAVIGLLNKTLKLDLNSRGCNAGVFYRRYIKKDFEYAEAVPAILDGE